MSGGRPTTPIRLDGQGKDHLRSIVCSRSEPHGMVERGGIVLACGEGESHVSSGSRLGISKMRSANGGGAIWSKESKARGRKSAPVVPAPMMTRGWPKWAIPPCTASLPRERVGASAPWPSIGASPNRRCIGGSRCLVCDCIGSITSKLQTILSLWRKCMTLWVCT